MENFWNMIGGFILLILVYRFSSFIQPSEKSKECVHKFTNWKSKTALFQERICENCGLIQQKSKNYYEDLK